MPSEGDSRSPQDTPFAIDLRPWGANDLPILEQTLGDPAMTEHLGGPENREQLAARHERFLQLADSGKGRMFVITDAVTGAAVGTVGYWDREWQGQQVYETGWSVLIPFQGRGIAGIATAQAIERARAERKYRYFHAFPSVDNLPSNGICRKLGFTLLGTHDYEYPPGNPMRCNDWRFDLWNGTEAPHR